MEHIIAVIVAVAVLLWLYMPRSGEGCFIAFMVFLIFGIPALIMVGIGVLIGGGLK